MDRVVWNTIMLISKAMVFPIMVVPRDSAHAESILETRCLRQGSSTVFKRNAKTFVFVFIIYWVVLPACMCLKYVYKSGGKGQQTKFQ